MRLPALPIVLLLACAARPVLALQANPLAVPDGWATGTTGGAGGTVDTATTVAEFTALLKKTAPYIIYVQGTMEGTFYLKTGNKSILGLPGAEILGSLTIEGASADSIVRNVIVRNLVVHPATTCTGDSGAGSCETFGDNFTLKYVRKVWLDHLTVHDGLDGNLDITHGCDSITLSWIKQYYTRTGIAHQFANLIGHSDKNGVEDSLRLRITWHHSWWGDGIRERMPRVRFGRVHLYNDLFTSSAANYCIRVAYAADVLAEGNVFKGTKDPVDFYTSKAIYPAGVITMRKNLYPNTTGDTASSGASFTPPYPYFLDNTATLESLVSDASSGAGADLTWGPSTRVEPSAPRSSGLRIGHKGGRTFVSNASSVRQFLSVWSTSGARLLPERALEPGSALEIPSNQGFRLVRARSESGETVAFVPR